MKGFSGKKLGLFLCSALLILGSAATVRAAYAVSYIRITFTSQYETDTVLEPDITTGSGYQADDVVWSKDLEKWKPGKKVTGEITLTASDGYSFADSYSRSKCSIYGADFVSVKVEDAQTAVVKVSYIPTAQLGQPEEAGWSDSSKTKAVWKKVPYATTYQVRLYKGGERINTLTSSVNSIDLSEYMKHEDSYFYEVRAIAKNSSEGQYLRSGEFITSDDTVLDDLGDTDGTWNDYQAGSRYRDSSGNYVTNTWKQISGKWYYFNSSGYALTGWQYINNQWYYLGTDGVMQTGWADVGGKWYYLKENGQMATGWIQTQPNTWYYLDGSGLMQTGWVSVGGKWYYFNSDGRMASSTVIDGYTLGPDGARV